MTFIAIDRKSYELLVGYFNMFQSTERDNSLSYRYKEYKIPSELTIDMILKLARYSNFLEVIDDNYSGGSLLSYQPDLFYFVSSMTRGGHND